MNKNAGPACALSVLIVGVFAVILHDKNPPVDHAKSQTSSPAPLGAQGHLARSQPSDPGTDLGARKAPSIPQPPSVAVPPSSTPPSVPPPSLEEASLTKLETIRAPDKLASSDMGTPLKSPDLDRTSRPTSLKGSFTVVREGEKLADVAARVYGSTDPTESLWRANRDQVAMIDSPLPRGTLLRTP